MIRDSVKLCIRDGMTPFAIAAAHGFVLNPDEVEELSRLEELHSERKE